MTFCSNYDKKTSSVFHFFLAEDPLPQHNEDHMITSLLFLFAFIAAPAQAIEWTGAQAQAMADVALPMTKHLAVRGAANWFSIPQQNKNLFFFYGGPKITVSKNLAIAPQVGLVNGWYNDGDDAAIISLWTWLNTGDFSCLIETEIYYSKGNPHTYYGFYAAEYTTMGLSAGLQAEEVNKGFSLGPHIAGTVGSVRIETDYFVSPSLGEHTLRFVATFAP